MERVPMTIEGHKALEAELQRLKSEERPRIIQAIAEARAHGDLSENAEYHSAKDAQGGSFGRSPSCFCGTKMLISSHGSFYICLQLENIASTCSQKQRTSLRLQILYCRTI